MFGLWTPRMRAGSMLGAFAMIAATVTIVAAAAQMMATALGAPGAGRFAAADLVVRADPTVTLGHGEDAEKQDVRRTALLPPNALGRVASVSGVSTAVGDVAFPLTVIGPGGRPVAARGGTPAHGHGWPSAALTPYRLIAGRQPVSRRDVVLDAGLARAGGARVGAPVRIVGPGEAGTFRVTGIVAAPRAVRQSAVFLTQARAQGLAGLGRGFNAIAIRALPGVAVGPLRERVATAVGGNPQVLDHRHASSADAGDPRAFDRVQLVAVLASGGGITLGIAIFVLAGTIAFAVERRRREIALVRAVGATPGQVRRILLKQTALIGLAAGAAGCLVATALFAPFARALVSTDLAPDGFRVAPHWIPYLIAVSVGVVVALSATFGAARRALRIRPAEAMTESATPAQRMSVGRLLLGLVALGGGTALVVTLSSDALAFATLAAFCFMGAVALLGPYLLGLPAALVGRVLSAGGGGAFLAGTSLRTGRFRVGAVGAAIALVVALAGTQVLGLATAQHAAQRTTAQRVQAAHVLVARAGGGLPPAVARAAARLPGVTAAGMVSTELYLLDGGLTNGGDSWDAAGLDPAAAAGVLHLDVRAGSLGAVRGTGIAVSDTLARHGAAQLGSTVSARLADNTPARLHVVAVYHRANGLGDVVLPHALALAHAATPLDSAVFVAGADDPHATAALHRLTRAFPTAEIRSRAQYLADVRAQGRNNARAQWVIVALMIAVAVMAAFNTGAMAAAQRRRELVLARLGGATRRQVIAGLTLESVVTTLVGIAAGVGVAIASLSRAGSDPHGGALVVPWDQAAMVLAGAAALGLIGTLLPAALVGRGRLTALAGLRE